ncbi:hypothetical protein STEG23_009529 [Scotinomys teguina]
MAGTFQEKSLFIFSDTDRALLTQAPEDTRTHRLIISSRKEHDNKMKFNNILRYLQISGLFTHHQRSFLQKMGANTETHNWPIEKMEEEKKGLEEEERKMMERGRKQRGGRGRRGKRGDKEDEEEMNRKDEEK